MDRMHDELVKLNGNGLLCTVVMIFFMTENKITSFCSFCISHPFIIANPRDMLMDLPDFLYNVKYCISDVRSLSIARAPGPGRDGWFAGTGWVLDEQTSI